MIKSILVSVVTFFVLDTFAQTRINNIHVPVFKSFYFSPVNSNQTLQKKSTDSVWYSMLEFASKDSLIGSTLQTGIGFLQHDSLAKIVYADGSTGHNNWLSAGRVLDPKDDIIDKTLTPVKLSKYVSYTLDSVRFTYAYVRNTDSIAGNAVTDTLFIAYYKGNTIHKYAFDPSGNKYALVDWQGDSIRMPLNYYAMDTVLLTSNDSTGVAHINGGFENYLNLKSITRKAPAGSAVDANGGFNTDNLIAYTFTFKSAIPTVSGTDTAIMIYQKDPSSLPSGSRRTNYFGFRYAINRDTFSWRNETYFNTSLLAPDWAAYTANNSWYGYVSGNAFINEYFIDADFHITTNNLLDIHEPANEDFSVSNIYPNPATVNEGAFISFDVKHQAPVTIEILNIIGQHVKTITPGSQAGNQIIELDLSGLKSGIYFVNISANNAMLTRKLLITE